MVASREYIRDHAPYANGDYIHDALRTENTPDFIRLPGASPEENRKFARLLHALLGMVTEVGEIADVLKQRVIYGKPIDEVNLVEEHGDWSWYGSVMLDAVDSDWDTSWRKNIAKLKARFPDKFTEEAALNRDLDAERRALAGVVHLPEHGEVAALRAEIIALTAERDGARVECENWKRRAEQHGCNVVTGDPECG